LQNSLDIIYWAQYILAMKKGSTVIILIFLVFIAAVFATGSINLSIGNNANLTWNVSQDISLSATQRFSIQRRTPQTTYSEVHSIIASSNVYSYQWTDPIYKTADVYYIYQIQLIDVNSNYVYVTSNPSGLGISSVKQTWGSIKAMFR